MSAVKRTFSLPKEISTQLDETIPDQKRSKFVAETLAEALKRQNRDKLIDALNAIEPKASVGRTSEEIIREIRQRHATKYTANLDADD